MPKAQLTFDARIENEPFARTVVAAFVAKLNPTMVELTEIKTIVSEAVANAIIHGYEGNEEKMIVLNMAQEDQTLVIEVIDQGVGIADIKQAKEPLFTTKADQERSGMGMTIMESLSDGFEITSKLNEGTKVKLTKRLKGHYEPND